MKMLIAVANGSVYIRTKTKQQTVFEFWLVKCEVGNNEYHLSVLFFVWRLANERETPVSIIH